jgi:hypothetical protein
MLMMCRGDFIPNTSALYDLLSFDNHLPLTARLKEMGYRSQFLIENIAILLFMTIGLIWFLILQVIRLIGFKDTTVRLLSVFT